MQLLLLNLQYCNPPHWPANGVGIFPLTGCLAAMQLVAKSLWTLLLPRDALLSAVYAVVVCLCVCVSVTLRYCIKTAKSRITQTTPHDSPIL